MAIYPYTLKQTFDAQMLSGYFFLMADLLALETYCSVDSGRSTWKSTMTCNV